MMKRIYSTFIFGILSLYALGTPTEAKECSVIQQCEDRYASDAEYCMAEEHDGPGKNTKEECKSCLAQSACNNRDYCYMMMDCDTWPAHDLCPPPEDDSRCDHLSDGDDESFTNILPAQPAQRKLKFGKHLLGH